MEQNLTWTSQIVADESPVAIGQAQYNANNQLTSRSGGSGRMFFSGRLDKEAAVTAAGTEATIDHRTTNFSAYVDVASGTNVIPIVATDYNGNSTTNRYQVVTTDNGFATTLTFDLNGNQTLAVTATATNSYQWDAANRLVGITSPTNQSVFTYDGAGRRVQIVEAVNGVAVSTNRYVWDGVEMSQERMVSGAVTKRFFNQGEQITGTNYYFTRDHLGSIREMVDDVGTIQARYDYDPYGRRTKVAGDMDADFGYTGHFYHSASGLWLTLYRAYDPDLGRWLSRDPIEEQGGLNLYGYVMNNPINHFDPLGLKTCYKWMLITFYTGQKPPDGSNSWNQSDLTEMDAATGLGGYEYDSKSRRGKKVGKPKGRDDYAYPPLTDFTIHRGKKGKDRRKVRDGGSGWVYPRPGAPNGVGQDEWLDLWTPKPKYGIEVKLVETEIGDNSSCAKGWSDNPNTPVPPNLEKIRGAIGF